jgi:hypothetical protein
MALQRQVAYSPSVSRPGRGSPYQAQTASIFLEAGYDTAPEYMLLGFWTAVRIVTYLCAGRGNEGGRRVLSHVERLALILTGLFCTLTRTGCSRVRCHPVPCSTNFFSRLLLQKEIEPVRPLSPYNAGTRCAQSRALRGSSVRQTSDRTSDSDIRMWACSLPPQLDNVSRMLCSRRFLGFHIHRCASGIPSQGLRTLLI